MCWPISLPLNSPLAMLFASLSPAALDPLPVSSSVPAPQLTAAASGCRVPGPSRAVPRGSSGGAQAPEPAERPELCLVPCLTVQWRFPGERHRAWGSC